MKVLKAGIDFQRAFEIDPQVGEQFLIKSNLATGWARLARVTRVMKSQVELEVTNVIPTEESNKFGTKNGLLDRGEGFFEDWAFRKKALIGKRVKFFKESGIMVGMSSDSWRQTVLVELLTK